MTTADHPANSLPSMAQLNRLLTPYQKADTSRSLGQLANTLIPYLLLWVLMTLAIRVSFWLMLPLAVLAAGFLVRIFIFFHDCGHNSFFPSTAWNRRAGFWLGVLVLTPGEQWWHSHAVHHATSGNLDKRGVGDVTTLTVAEYRALKAPVRLAYRLFRSPLIMFGLGPLFMFLLSHRLARPKFGKKETRSVILTNLALLGLGGGASLLMGWREYLTIQVLVMWLGGMVGIWMFYLQHQFEDAYWARGDAWNYVSSALRGASYYRLPRVLEWFTGSIGYHHIHHLSPRIPNYNLRSAQENLPEIRRFSRVIGLRESLSTPRFKLWDEEAGRMVGFPRRAGQTLPAAEPPLN